MVHHIKMNVEWEVHSSAGVSINWVGGRSMSWVKCQEQQCGGSEVTLAASGRKAGTNKSVSVSDSLLHCAFQTIHCQYVVFTVSRLTFRAIFAGSSPFDGALLHHPSTHTSPGGALK